VSRRSDWKVRAGKKAEDVSAYETELLQVAAYCRAEHVLLPDGSVAPFPAIEGGSIVMLCDDSYALSKVDLDRDFVGFEAAFRLHSWKEGMK